MASTLAQLRLALQAMSYGGSNGASDHPVCLKASLPLPGPVSGSYLSSLSLCAPQIIIYSTTCSV